MKQNGAAAEEEEEEEEKKRREDRRGQKDGTREVHADHLGKIYWILTRAAGLPIRTGFQPDDADAPDNKAAARQTARSLRGGAQQASEAMKKPSKSENI